MNTKQLWQALTNNSTTEPYFDGIFPIDVISKIKNKPELIICNTDPSDKPGKHWVLFFFNNNEVEFYDPLGNHIDFYGEEFINFAIKFSSKYLWSTIRTQPLNSSTCGQYCLYFAFKKCQGQTMESIINSMTSPEHVLNFVDKHFDICESNCCKFQSCIDN